MAVLHFFSPACYWLCLFPLAFIVSSPVPTRASKTCLDSGCTYSSLGCTYNKAWKDLVCMDQDIAGSIYVTDIPYDTKYIYLKGNPKLAKIDPRSYDGHSGAFLLDENCPVRGCSYKYFHCVYAKGIKMLNCANRGIIGKLYLTDLPGGLKTIRLENNLITELSPLMFYDHDEVATFGGLITGVKGVGPHSTLTEVFAFGNMIRTVDPELFKGCPAVEKIYLANNRIERIPDRATFEGLNIQTLDLAENIVPRKTRCEDVVDGCAWWGMGCKYSMQTMDCSNLKLTGNLFVADAPWDMARLRTENNMLDAIDPRALVVKAGTAVLTRDSTTSIQCMPKTGCGWFDLKCAWYDDMKQMNCEARQLKGHLYINDLPGDVQALFITDNPGLNFLDPRSLEGKADFTTLEIDEGVRIGCPETEGCKYSTLHCAYDDQAKTLDCSRRNLAGPIYITDVPNDCEYLDVSNNALTTLGRWTTIGKTSLQYVRLDNNNITYLDQSMFHGLFLTNVYLANNPVQFPTRSCPPGTGVEENSVQFAQAPRVRQWYNCPACEQGCAECSSLQTCTKCKDQYFLAGGDCFEINTPRDTSPIEEMEGLHFPNYENEENYPGRGYISASEHDPHDPLVIGTRPTTPYADIIETPDYVVPFRTAPTDALNYQGMGQRTYYKVHWEQYAAHDWGAGKCQGGTVPVASLEECEFALEQYIKTCPTYFRGQGEHVRAFADDDPYASTSTLSNANGVNDANSIGVQLKGALELGKNETTYRILPRADPNAPPNCYVKANATAMYFNYNMVHNGNVPVPDASPLCIDLNSAYVGGSEARLPQCFMGQPHH